MGETDVHGDTLRMDSSQVRVFKEGYEVSLSSFLERQHGARLEAKVRLSDIQQSVSQPQSRRPSYILKLTLKS